MDQMLGRIEDFSPRTGLKPLLQINVALISKYDYAIDLLSVSSRAQVFFKEIRPQLCQLQSRLPLPARPQTPTARAFCTPDESAERITSTPARPTASPSPTARQATDRTPTTGPIAAHFLASNERRIRSACSGRSSDRLLPGHSACPTSPTQSQAHVAPAATRRNISKLSFRAQRGTCFFLFPRPTSNFDPRQNPSHSPNPIRSTGRASRSQPTPDRLIHSATCPKSGRPCAPLRPQLPSPNRRQTLLESTLTQPPTTVDSKPLTATLSPLSATLTKN